MSTHACCDTCVTQCCKNHQMTGTHTQSALDGVPRNVEHCSLEICGRSACSSQLLAYWHRHCTMQKAQRLLCGAEAEIERRVAAALAEERKQQQSQQQQQQQQQQQHDGDAAPPAGAGSDVATGDAGAGAAAARDAARDAASAARHAEELRAADARAEERIAAARAEAAAEARARAAEEVKHQLRKVILRFSCACMMLHHVCRVIKPAEGKSSGRRVHMAGWSCCCQLETATADVPAIDQVMMITAVGWMSGCMAPDQLPCSCWMSLCKPGASQHFSTGSSRKTLKSEHLVKQQSSSAYPSVYCFKLFGL